MTTPVNAGPITGNEPRHLTDSRQEALAHFYRAFNRADLEDMRDNWLNTHEASMSNPLGGVKRGWDDISTVYARIFSGRAKVYVEFYDYTIVGDQTWFQAVGRERGQFALGDSSIALQIRTSRTFVMRGGRYQQLHHHGSIETPALLDSYQQAVKTGSIG